MLTWWMEQEIDKKRLLEVYLNIVEWGPGIFGIGPASEHYFHCTPAELSCTQATWLASILVNPSLFYYMKTNGKINESMRSMIRFVMRAMNKQGGISEEELNKAEETNFEVYFPSPPDKEDKDIDVVQHLKETTIGLQ
jgi:membrane peptidoglycan carboxypeptidase